MMTWICGSRSEALKRAQEKKFKIESSQIPWPWLHGLQDVLVQGDFSKPAPRPTELLPWLYMSNLATAQNFELLQRVGITHVISTNEMPHKIRRQLTNAYRRKKIKHKYVPAKDEETYDMIGNHWEDCRAFVEEAKKDPNAKILVHCFAGKNRSVTIAAAVLLLLDDDGSDNGQKKRSPTLLRVIRKLSRKLGMILTNEAFQIQLCLLAEKEGRLGPKPNDSFSLPSDSQTKAEIFSSAKENGKTR